MRRLPSSCYGGNRMSAPTVSCQKCGKLLGPTMRFCGMCGTPVIPDDDGPPTDIRSDPEATIQMKKGHAPKPAKPAPPNRAPARTAPMSGKAGQAPAAAPAPPAKPAPPAAASATPAIPAPLQAPKAAAPVAAVAAPVASAPAAPVAAPAAAVAAPAAPVASAPVVAPAARPGDEDGAPTEIPPRPLEAVSVDIPKPTSSRSEFQRLLEEVETGFESIVTPEPDPPPQGAPPVERPRPKASDPTGEIPHDLTEARALFDAMVVEHARPVRDFMIEVRLGEPLRAWVDFSMPAIRAILRSAQGMGIGEFAEKIQSFMKALEFAQSGSDRLVRGQVRQAIIDTYSELTAYMPAAFALEQESNRRESVIVHSLLMQVPGLHKVGIDRIYGAGLTSLALFYVARPSDISELTGISVELAQSVVARFRDYRKRTESLSPEHNRAAELAALSELANTLERVVGEYDGQPAGNVGDAKKRELRRVRGDAMIEIGLQLARLGEVDRLREIEKLPFAARAASVRVFVAEAQKQGRGTKP